jgi:hypothetical protein
VVAGGSSHVIELDEDALRNACLINGVLCVVSESDMKLRLEYSLPRMLPTTLNINMVDCTNGQVHPVKSFMEGRYGTQLNDVYRNSLMNDVSPTFFPKYESFGVFFCKPNVMIIPEEESCLEITFECDPKIVDEQNTKLTMKAEKIREVEEKKEKAEVTKRFRMKECKAKFVNNRYTELQGKIVTCMNTYGFIQISTQEAKPLGNILVFSYDIRKKRGTRSVVGKKGEG